MSYSVIRHTESDIRVKRLLELAVNPGLQRARVKPVLAEIGTGYALRVSYGRGSALIAGNGDLYVGRVDSYAEDVDADSAEEGRDTTVRDQGPIHDDPAGMEVGLASGISAVTVPGSAPMNKAIGTMHVPCGICVIVAKGGAGKTPLAHHLAGFGVDEYATIRVGEPFAGYTTNRNTVARDLGRAMISHSDVVLDSIKDLLAEGGSAMRGGIARAALVDLSAWATQAAALGTTIYVPLNPSGDEDLITLMTEVARSNATMTVSHRSGDLWEYSSRTGEGLERVSGQYSFGRTTGRRVAREDRELIVQFDASMIDRTTFAGLLQRSKTI